MIFIGIWLFLGLCGYFMMRQGFLVSFERVLGKKATWGYWDVILGLIYTLYGPFVIIHALSMDGKKCFQRRKKGRRKNDR